MPNNIQITIDSDGAYSIFMRGKSFKMILDHENKTYELVGDIPEDVTKNPKKFLEWVVPKIEDSLISNNYSYIQ